MTPAAFLNSPGVPVIFVFFISNIVRIKTIQGLLKASADLEERFGFQYSKKNLRILSLRPFFQ